MYIKEATTRPTSSTQRDHKQPSVIEYGMYYNPKSVQAQQLSHAVGYFLTKDIATTL